MNVSQVLDAVSAALTVIKTVSQTPGVNVLPYATTVSAAVGAIQAAISAGKDIAPYVTAISDTFTGTVPTQAQLDALDAKIAELESLVDAPLPPQENGEPA